MEQGLVLLRALGGARPLGRRVLGLQHLGRPRPSSYVCGWAGYAICPASLDCP